MKTSSPKEIRKFGIVALVFFGILFGLGLWRQKIIVTCFFGVLSLLGLGFVVAPDFMEPVHRGWLKIASMIGKAVTVVILTLAYYLVITPSGFIKRIFGGRPLPMAPDKDLPTYWVYRSEPAQPKDRFINRY